MEWSPTRRDLLRAVAVGGPAGFGGSPADSGGSPAGLGNVSWRNATDAVPDHPFVPTPDVEWSVEAEGDQPLLRYAETDDTVYVGTATGARGFSTDGTERWRRSIASVDVRYPVELYPGRGVVYAEGETGLHALDADDGHTRWRYAGDTGVAEGHVDVSVVTPETVFLRENGVTAVAASDGRERWRFDPGDSIWLRPHAAGDALYVGTIRGHLYALDAADGTVRWHADRSGDEKTPRLGVAGATDDAVLAWDSEAGALYGFDVADGSLRWRFDADTDAAGFPGAVRDDAAYLADGPVVRALSAADGTERWRYDAGSPTVGHPRFDGRIGYFGTAGGVRAVSTTDGRERWRFATGAEAWAYVAGVAGGTAVVDSRTDAVYGLDAADGSLRWRFGYSGHPSWFPAVAADAAYFATESGTVYALSLPDSTPVYDAYRTLASPAGLAVGGVVGAAALARAYRRRRRHRRPRAPPPDPETFGDFERLDARAGTDAGVLAAEVYDARTPDSERVVLRRFDPEAVPAERFASAVETWADLDAWGVLDVRWWGTDPAPWVATEYADATLAERAPDLSTVELGRALADTAETLHRAHREGVVHGGPDAENVWLSDGDVLVGDWRLATECGDAAVRPPEPDADPATVDAYRLAVLADDLLADDRPDDLRDVVSRALADDPADRYDSALKFADALRWAVRE